MFNWNAFFWKWAISEDWLRENKYNRKNTPSKVGSRRAPQSGTPFVHKIVGYVPEEIIVNEVPTSYVPALSPPSKLILEALSACSKVAFIS